MMESKKHKSFAEDREKIVRSRAFRRLQAKSQVFVFNEGDHYRTRLTHCLEVALVSRSMARSLKINEDLTEAIALGHDLGHPPFGHSGEAALNECMKQYGGFDHNLQTLRQVLYMEKPFLPDEDVMVEGTDSTGLNSTGLNLSFECIEGLAKHNGAISSERDQNNLLSYCPSISKYLKQSDLGNFGSIEAQVAAAADEITYVGHDLEDGLRSGIINADQIYNLNIIQLLFSNKAELVSKIEHAGYIVTKFLCDSLIAEARVNLNKKQGVKALVIFQNAETGILQKELRDFLYNNFYNDYRVRRMTYKAKRIIFSLFELFAERPEMIPEKWQKRMHKEQYAMLEDNAAMARLITDYIAGMTDAFAMDEYSKLFDLKPHFR